MLDWDGRGGEEEEEEDQKRKENGDKGNEKEPTLLKSVSTI